MRYPDVCEIATGLVLKGQYPPNALCPEELLSPYDDLIRCLQKSPDTTPEHLIQKFGLSAYQAAEQAAATLNGTQKSDWLGILHETYEQYKLGNMLERNGKRLMDGKEADFAAISAQISQMETDVTRGVLLSEVKKDFAPFQKCGYEPFDTHLGGMPQSGVVLVGAKSKSGKTTLLIDIASAYANFQEKKDIGIFTLEMLADEFRARAKDLGMPARLMNRIVVWDGQMSAAEVMAAATKEQLQRQIAGKRPLGMIGVDFADLMIINEENSEAAMANIYRIMAQMAKSMRLPVFLLSQLSRGYIGGLPRPNHIRYTSLAEALSWQILMLYNPNTDWSEESGKVELPREAGVGYILAWACRGGFRNHDGPGAIEIDWNGGSGWGKKARRWHPLTKVD